MSLNCFCRIGVAPRMAVVRGEVPVQFAQVQELVDAAEQMLRRDVNFQAEGVEQRRLTGFLTRNHRDDVRLIEGT